MVVLGEALGLIADVFQQPQGVGVAGESQGLALARHEHLLLPLGQRDHAGRFDTQALERVEGR